MEAVVDVVHELIDACRCGGRGDTPWNGSGGGGRGVEAVLEAVQDKDVGLIGGPWRNCDGAR